MQVNDFNEIYVDESFDECNLECKNCKVLPSYRLNDISLINQNLINNELFKHNHHRTNGKNGKTRNAGESRNALLCHYKIFHLNQS